MLYCALSESGYKAKFNNTYVILMQSSFKLIPTKMPQKEVLLESELNGTKNKDFEWSMKPIIVLMNILRKGMVINTDIIPNTN